MPPSWWLSSFFMSLAWCGYPRSMRFGDSLPSWSTHQLTLAWSDTSPRGTARGRVGKRLDIGDLGDLEQAFDRRGQHADRIGLAQKLSHHIRELVFGLRP